MGSRTASEAELERLVASAAGGEDPAWHAFWRQLEPALTALVRRPSFMAHMSRNEDDRRDVVVAVMARLRADGYHRLQLYLAARRADPELTFMRWLAVVAKRVAIDCLRAHPDYVDRRRSHAAEDSPGVWIKTEVLPGDASLSGGRPPMTNRVTARQILRFAAGALTEPQRRALEMWAEQASYDDIALALLLDGPDDADRLIRSAVERLRRHFRERKAR